MDEFDRKMVEAYELETDRLALAPQARRDALARAAQLQAQRTLLQRKLGRQEQIRKRNREVRQAAARVFAMLTGAGAALTAVALGHGELESALVCLLGTLPFLCAGVLCDC